MSLPSIFSYTSNQSNLFYSHDNPKDKTLFRHRKILVNIRSSSVRNLKYFQCWGLWWKFIPSRKSRAHKWIKKFEWYKSYHRSSVYELETRNWGMMENSIGFLFNPNRMRKKKKKVAIQTIKILFHKILWNKPYCAIVQPKRFHLNGGNHRISSADLKAHYWIDLAALCGQSNYLKLAINIWRR